MLEYAHVFSKFPKQLCTQGFMALPLHYLLFQSFHDPDDDVKGKVFKLALIKLPQFPYKKNTPKMLSARWQ